MDLTTEKIAPSACEITREGNVFSCEFNNMQINWVLCKDCKRMRKETEKILKDRLSMAILLSSKMWQAERLLNQNLPFKSELFVNGEKV